VSSPPEKSPDGELSATSILGEMAVTWMDSHTLPGVHEALSLMIRPESLALAPGNQWRVTETYFAGHDGLVTLKTGEKEADGQTVRILVPARQMPDLGAVYDVIVTGAALGYRS
jgi:hypothetical protein